jgi:hypothetical protein
MGSRRKVTSSRYLLLVYSKYFFTFRPPFLWFSILEIFYLRLIVYGLTAFPFSVNPISIKSKLGETILGKGFLAILDKRFQMLSYSWSVMGMDFYSFRRHDCVQSEMYNVVKELTLFFSIRENIN